MDHAFGVGFTRTQLIFERYFAFVMDKAHIAELRREIEAIEEQNRLYRARKHHRSYLDEMANNRRMARLQEIKQELAALRTKK